MDQWWPDTPEDPPYQVPDALDDWPYEGDPPGISIHEWLVRLKESVVGYKFVWGTTTPLDKKGYHTRRAYVDEPWSVDESDPLADIEAARESVMRDSGYERYVPPHVWHTHTEVFKSKKPWHVHVDKDGEELFCAGTHPTTKTLKNGREMPLIKRGTGPHRGQFEKGGKGHYDRKSTDRGR